MGDQFKNFLKENLTFTPKARTWAIGLSAAGIAFPFLIPTLFSMFPGTSNGSEFYLFLKLLYFLPLMYFVLFIIFRSRRSQYAPVCFVRGAAHLLPFQPFVSLMLIGYLMSSRSAAGDIPGVTSPSNFPGNRWNWQDFFLPVITTLVLLGLSVGIYMSLFPPTDAYSRSYSRVIAEALIWATILGVPILFLATIVFALMRRASLALGSLLSVFLLVLSLFVGCAMNFRV